MRAGMKLLFVYVIIALFFTLLVPESGIGERYIEPFVNPESLNTGNFSFEAGGEEHTLKPEQPTGVIPEGWGLLSPLLAVWGLVKFAFNIVALPVSVAHYMLALGAPAEVALIVAVPLAAMPVFAIADFVRG